MKGGGLTVTAPPPDQLDLSHKLINNNGKKNASKSPHYWGALFWLRLVYFFLLGGRNQAYEMFSCHAQSLDSVRADESRREYPFDAPEAIIASLDDICMDRKGYNYTGGADVEFCVGHRIPQCYTAKWWKL